MKDYKIMMDQAEKALGFVPNALYEMSKKPNILSTFVMLMVNVRGFSAVKVTPFTAMRLMFKNIKFIIQAKRNAHLELPVPLKDLISHVASNASGCRYCQAHTAHMAHRNGTEVEKLQKVWEFQTSDLFSEQEKAALNFAWAAGSSPNQVTPQHHVELKRFFSEKQIIEIMGTVSVFGFLNRWNDSMATPLEEEPLQFAQKYLSKTWDAGKHVTVQ